MDDRAVMPWLFGGADTMHGKPATYSDAPQISLDEWHPLNLDGALEFVSEGETFFRIKQTRNDVNVAYLVFNRPVPPGENGKPGKLVIKLMHKSGILYAVPGGAVSIPRTLDMPLLDLRVSATPGLTVSAIRASDHSALFGEPEIGQDGLARYKPLQRQGALVAAKDRYILSIRFDRDAQRAMAAIARSFSRLGEKPAIPQTAKSLNMPAIYGVLAAVFGIGFVITLLYTFRTSREVQRLRVNEAHASRHEILRALSELEDDFARHKLPASSYLEHRRRLLNRAIDVEARKGAK
jgi:hypothetical protein